MKNIGKIAQAFRESFICLVPYLIVMSLGSLIFQGLVLIKIYENSEIINAGVYLLRSALPYLVLTSFSYQLSKLKNIDGAISIVLSLSIFLVFNQLNLTEKASPFDATLSSVYAILIPAISISLLVTIFHSKFSISPKYNALDESVRLIYRYTPAFVLSFVITITVLKAANFAFNDIAVYCSNNLDLFADNSTLFIFTRTLISHLMTFLGVHGVLIFDLVINNQYLINQITPNLGNFDFIVLFVVFGGVGSSLSLAIAILLFAKDQHSINITKVAMPFLIFNVSEILFSAYQLYSTSVSLLHLYWCQYSTS